MILVQLSDTHFGTERPPVLEALVAWMQQQAPDLVIFSGDITQRARRSQFQAARRFIDRIPKHELLTIPGNHDLPLFDLPRRFLNPYGYYREFFGSSLEPTYEDDQVLIIGLNTTSPWRHKDGKVTDRQIRRVERQLSQAGGRLKILVAHHPFDVILTSDEENLMIHGEKAIRRWAEAGLDMVLGGHIHFPFAASLRGRYPDLARDVWCIQAGTTISRRVRNSKPNSFNRIQIGADRASVTVERWDYDAEEGQFQQVACFQPWSTSETHA